MRTIDLFCGAGLLGAGFANAGFKPVFAADLDEDAIETYNRNSRHNIAKVHSAEDIIAIKGDVIIAGPPCQGFSSLGKRNKKDARNKLSLALIDWAKKSDAKVVVVENVPQFLKSDYWAKLVKEFSKMGFENTHWVLDASEYGVAQKRVRSFTIFSKIGLPEKPKPSKRNMTVRDAFAGLSPKALRDGMHSSPPPSELALKRISKIPLKGSKVNLMMTHPELCPESWFALGGQATDVWGRIDLDKASNTIRCAFQNPSKGRYLHPSENRVITLREGARLQGVSDEWIFSGSRTSIAKQIGNGVPIPLAEAVAKSIKKLF